MIRISVVEGGEEMPHDEYDDDNATGSQAVWVHGRRP